MTSGTRLSGVRFVRGLIGGIVSAIAVMLVSTLSVPSVDGDLLPIALVLAWAPLGIAVAFWTRGITGFIGLYLGGLIGTVAILVATGWAFSADGWQALFNVLLVAALPVLPLPGYVLGRLVDRAIRGQPALTAQLRVLLRSIAVVSPLVLLVLTISLRDASLDRARRGSCPTVRPAPEAGGRLAYVGVNAICVTDLTTGEIVFKFEGDVTVDRSFGTPSWAPDGSAFAVEVTSERRPTTVIVPLDGSAPLTLTPPDGAWSVRDPDWSPDGRSLATVVDDVGCSDCGRLALYEFSTSRWELPSMKLPAGINEPDWSPDGERLVVRGSADDVGPAAPAVVIRKDGSLVFVGVRDMSSYLGAAAWSPDGGSVVVPRIDDHGSAHLWTTAPDGSDRREVTFTGDSDGPAWSPDGRWLAFDWNDPTISGIRDQIWFTGADGGTPHLLVDGGTHAAWAP